MSGHTKLFLPTLLLVMTISVSGCSFFLVKGPADDGSPIAPGECTESRWVPALDLALGLLALGVSAYIVSNEPEWAPFPTFWGAVAVGGLAGWSTVVGHRRVSACERALSGGIGRSD